MAATTELQRRLEEERRKGRGINPGKSKDPMGEAAAEIKRKIATTAKKVGGAVKRTVYPQIRKATPAEEESYKLRGQRAYYEGKIKRNEKKNGKTR